jgi:hypothetical protein
MPREITAGDVEAAEAELASAKKGKDSGKRQAAMDRVAELRSAFRLQEEKAGRRVGLVGGDARAEG